MHTDVLVHDDLDTCSVVNAAFAAVACFPICMQQAAYIPSVRWVLQWL